MAGDAARVADMRGGADRAFALALLASILLHALALSVLPSLQSLVVEVAARTPQPLVARLAQPELPPAPVPAPAPTSVEEGSLPQPPVARPRVRRAAAQPAPKPVQPPAAEPAPPPRAAPSAPAVPGPLARIDPLPATAPPAHSDALESYRTSVNAAATRFKRYPRAAIDNNWEGEVVVLLTIGADGRIAGMHVRKSSGYEILDRQALDMFRNAKPFVPLPRELRGREFEVELRAIYSLKDQGSG